MEILDKLRPCADCLFASCCEAASLDMVVCRAGNLRTIATICEEFVETHSKEEVESQIDAMSKLQSFFDRHKK